MSYAAKDARDFARTLQAQKGGLYRDVNVKVLANASKGDILDGLEWLERETTSKDVAMAFLAGHGVNDRSGNYHFLPQDADTERLKRTALAYHSVRDTIANLPGKALLFVDSCHSGNIIGARRG